MPPFDPETLSSSSASLSSFSWLLLTEPHFLFAHACARLAHCERRFPAFSAQFGPNPTAVHLARGVRDHQITVVVDLSNLDAMRGVTRKERLE